MAEDSAMFVSLKTAMFVWLRTALCLCSRVVFQKTDVQFHCGFFEQLCHVMSRVRRLDVLHGVGFLKVVVPVEVPALPEGDDDSDGHGETERERQRHTERDRDRDTERRRDRETEREFGL